MAEKTRRYNPQDDVFSLINGKKVPVRGYNIAQPSPKKTPSGTDLSMEFDGQKLTLQVKDGGKVVRHSVPAVSGRPDGEGAFVYTPERQQIPNEGPIPEGTYPVNLQDLQYIKDVPVGNRIGGALSGVLKPLLGKKTGAFPGDKPAWGVGRIPVQASQEQLDGSGRKGGFFIHGGYKPGSAGCIDLVDKDQHFFDLVEKYRGTRTNIPLTVDYSRTPKKVYYGGKK